jgi:hypothetical protein
LHDVGHQDGVDFLVMEYLEGASLARRLEKGPLGLDDALRVAVQIAGAVALFSTRIAEGPVSASNNKHQYAVALGRPQVFDECCP